MPQRETASARAIRCRGAALRGLPRPLLGRKSATTLENDAIARWTGAGDERHEQREQTMGFIDSVKTFFTPKDDLYKQAEEMIRGLDTDRDGKVNLKSLVSTGGAGMLNGIPGRSLLAADGEGNGNGEVYAYELRNHMKQFDLPSPWNPDKGDKFLDQREMNLMFQTDMGMGGYYGGTGGYGGMGYGGYNQGYGGYGMGLQGGYGAQGGFGLGIGFNLGGQGGILGGGPQSALRGAGAVH